MYAIRHDLSHHQVSFAGTACIMAAMQAQVHATVRSQAVPVTTELDYRLRVAFRSLETLN
jgi:hypothetical protein